MSDTQPRLLDCFASVFPQIAKDKLAATTMDTVPDWDSMNTVTLVAVIQEEFGIEIPIDQYPNLTSFAGTLELVERLKK